MLSFLHNRCRAFSDRAVAVRLLLAPVPTHSYLPALSRLRWRRTAGPELAFARCCRAP